VILASPLTPLEDVLRSVLEWLGPHGAIGLPWAWSIVALTVVVRVLLVPVAIKQIHSMQSLQIHAPEMKAIQQRYKSDRQKQSEELMKFYRENKINPYASCLPIVFQIPIFIALFYVLKDFEKEIFPQFPESTLQWLNLVDITEPTKDGWGPVLLLVYVASQLTSISDVYDAICTTRPYAKARSREFALNVLTERIGTFHSSALVANFVRMARVDTAPAAPGDA